MTKRFVLTFDIDWAPDFAILYCLELLDDAKCKATFFATHSTSLNQEIVNRGHDLGIHPNFLKEVHMVQVWKKLFINASTMHQMRGVYALIA